MSRNSAHDAIFLLLFFFFLLFANLFQLHQTSTPACIVHTAAEVRFGIAQFDVREGPAWKSEMAFFSFFLLFV